MTRMPRRSPEHRFSRAQRRQLFAHAGGRCQWCRTSIDPLSFHADHIIPIAGGANRAAQWSGALRLLQLLQGHPIVPAHPCPIAPRCLHRAHASRGLPRSPALASLGRRVRPPDRGPTRPHEPALPVLRTDMTEMPGIELADIVVAFAVALPVAIPVRSANAALVTYAAPEERPVGCEDTVSRQKSETGRGSSSQQVVAAARRRAGAIQSFLQDLVRWLVHPALPAFIAAVQ